MREGGGRSRKIKKAETELEKYIASERVRGGRKQSIRASPRESGEKKMTGVKVRHGEEKQFAAARESVCV